MALLVLEVHILTSVEPKGVGFVRFKFHFENAGFLIGFVSRLAEWRSVGAFPRLNLTPGTIGHFLAEGDFDIDCSRGNIRGPRFRHGLDHDWWHRVDALLSAEHERRESTEGNNGDEFDNSCF